MTDQLAAQLNQFYRDFNTGQIDFAEYRRRRGMLLDSLVEMSTAQDENLETLPRIAKPPETLETPVDAKPVPAPKKEPNKVLIIGGVLVLSLLVVAVVVTLVLKQIERDEPEIVRTNREAPEILDLQELAESQGYEQTLTLPPDAGQELVEEFLAADDWRRMSVDQFQDTWGRLPAADRIVAKGAVWFEPMMTELLVQIDGARSVAVNPNNDRELDTLYELALRLGLVELVPPGWTPKIEPVAKPRPAPVATTRKTDPVAAQTPAPAKAEPMVAAVVAPSPDRMESAPKTTAGAANASNKNACSVAQLSTRRRNCFDLVSADVSGPLLKVLAAGSVGGSGTAAEIRVDEPFAIGIFEVTQEEYAIYCVASSLNCESRTWSGNDMPRVNVSWHDAVAYADWLSEVTGQRYRLPTKIEWEYAARAGAQTAFPYGDKLGPTQARYSSVIRHTEPLPTTDDTTQKNQFGLWHVVGNVAEWVSDDAGGGKKNARGGSFASKSDGVMSSSAVSMNSNDKNRETGFRLVREL